MRACTACLADLIKRHTALRCVSTGILPQISRSFGTSAISAAARINAPNAARPSNNVSVGAASTSRSVKGKSRAPKGPPAPTSSRTTGLIAETPKLLKSLMYDDLQKNKPRAALQRLLASWKSPAAATWDPAKLVGHVSLLLAFKRADVALEAVEKLHEIGFRVPATVAVRVLAGSKDQLVANPDQLATVVGWVERGMTDEGVGAMDPELVHVVMSTLIKMGRTDWGMGIFDAWVRSLAADQVGSAKVWSRAIALHALDDDARGARDVFFAWRERWKSVHRAKKPVDSRTPPLPPPPEEPYTTLINFLATKVLNVPDTRDPIYRILKNLLVDDGVPLSTGIYNSLLRVELNRRRFASFWGIWIHLDDGPHSRSHATWRLAVQAKVSRDALRRQRGRKIGSPLQSIMPQLSDSRAPTSRELFRRFLMHHQALTAHRPSLRLPTKSRPIMSSSTLNAFLNMFVQFGDWPACTVVLESFGVHRVEPDERTHGTVVVGVVKHWEKGKLKGNLREADGLWVDDEGPSRFERWQEMRRAQMMGGERGLELISRIVETRKMRVKMWVRDEQQGDEQHSTDRLDGVPGPMDVVTAGISPNGPLLPPPKWMIQREMRELGYLVSLLRRSQGLEEDEWASHMADVRKEMLPPRKTVRSEQGGSAALNGSL